MHALPATASPTHTDVTDIFGFTVVEQLSYFFDLFMEHAGRLTRGASADSLSLLGNFNQIEHYPVNVDPAVDRSTKLGEKRLALFVLALGRFNQKLKDNPPTDDAPLPDYPAELMEGIFMHPEPLDANEKATYVRYLSGSHIREKMEAALYKIKDILMLRQNNLVRYSLSPETIRAILEAFDYKIPPHADTSLRHEISYYRTSNMELLLDPSSANLISKALHYAPDVMEKPLCRIMTEIFNRPAQVDLIDHALSVGSTGLIPFLQGALGIPSACIPLQSEIDASHADTGNHHPVLQRLEHDISLIHRNRLACILVQQLLETISLRATLSAAQREEVPAASLWQMIKGDAAGTGELVPYSPEDSDTLERQKDALLTELQVRYAATPAPSDGKIATLRLLQCSAWLESFFYPLSRTTAVTYLRILAMGIVVAASVFDYYLTAPNPSADRSFELAFALVILAANVLQFRPTAYRDFMRRGGERSCRTFLKSPTLVFAGLSVLTLGVGGFSLLLENLAEKSYNPNANGLQQSTANAVEIYAWSLAQYAFFALAVESGMKLLSIFGGIAAHCSPPGSCLRRSLGDGHFVAPAAPGIQLTTLQLNSITVEDPGSPARSSALATVIAPGSNPRPHQDEDSPTRRILDYTTSNRPSDADSYTSVQLTV